MGDTARKLQCAMEQGLNKLISWQVGMGVEKRNGDGEWDGRMGLGGVQNHKDEPGLRIDVCQHQMHATILARRYAYAQADAAWPWETVAM